MKNTSDFLLNAHLVMKKRYLVREIHLGRMYASVVSIGIYSV